MILRLFAIHFCLALFRGVTPSNIITENFIEEKEQPSSLNANEQSASDIIESPELKIDYPNITVKIYDPANSNTKNINSSTLQVSCLKTMVLFQPVEIVNATHLASVLQGEANITSRHTPAQCVGVLFYSPSCPFSVEAGQHFNALAWYYPDVKLVAIDALTHRTFNAQYGIFGIPTLILFHNGRPAAKLNETFGYNLRSFVKFIYNHTDLKPTHTKVNMFLTTIRGPIASALVSERDYYLLLSWGVIILHLLYSFYQSSWGRWLVDATLSAWREAEAQHHHID